MYLMQSNFALHTDIETVGCNGYGGGIDYQKTADGTTMQSQQSSSICHPFPCLDFRLESVLTDRY